MCYVRTECDGIGCGTKLNRIGLIIGCGIKLDQIGLIVGLAGYLYHG